MDAVKKYCNKAILIKDGEIIASGDPHNVADQYSLENAHELNYYKTKNDSSKELRYPNGLNQRVPVLRITPVSPKIVDGESPFVFDVEYEYAISDRQGYLGLILQDARRGGQIYDVDTQSEYFGLPIEKGHHKVRFSIPIEQFNNGEFRIFATIRSESEESERPDYVAFTNDDFCCYFAVRNDRNSENGILSDRALTFNRID